MAGEKAACFAASTAGMRSKGLPETALAFVTFPLKMSTTTRTTTFPEHRQLFGYLGLRSFQRGGFVFCLRDD
jgi:hypothetical protein